MNMKSAIAMAVLAAVLMPWDGARAQTETQGIYQIMKATEERVWRLNTQTGEIAVCALKGENLVCTATTEAPTKSYAEIEAEQAKDAEAAAERKAAERERDLKILDKILALFRELLATALGEQSGG